MRRVGTRALLLPLLATLASCDNGPTQPPDSAACATAAGTLTIASTPVTENEVGILDASSCLLGRGSYADRWEFVLTEAADIEILVHSDDFDPFLILRDANDRYITADDDNGPDLDARLAFAIAAGTYYIFPTTYLDGAVGNYTLTINATAVPVP